MAARSATATWRLPCRRARASAWRAWSSWSSEAHEWLRPQSGARARATPAGCAATTRTRSTWTPSAASSWWWTASAGRPRARRRRRSRWSACARAWSGRPAPPSSASARPSRWPTTKFCARRAATRSGRAWPACSRWWCWRTARRWSGTWAIRASTRCGAARSARSRTIIRRSASARTAGELSEAEAMRHPRRNEVFRDVGSRGAHARRRRFHRVAALRRSTPIARCCCAATG